LVEGDSVPVTLGVDDDAILIEKTAFIFAVVISSLVKPDE